MQSLFRTLQHQLTAHYPVSEAKALVKMVLSDYFHINWMDLYMGKDIKLSPNQLDELKDIIARLEKFEPIQYILGEAYFMGIPFKVTPAVLIPRPETAELVHRIVREQLEQRVSILDIGTGSGCIAISLASQLPLAKVTALDVSLEALEVAKYNAKRRQVDIDFVQMDILQQTPTGCFDCVVSNPPYITAIEKQDMQPNVLEYEPSLALFVHHDDPLLFYRAIATKALALLRPNGSLYFEINRAYGQEMIALLESLSFKEITLHKDMYGNNRFIKACR